MGNYEMQEEITTVSLADMEGKLDLNFIGSLEIKDPLQFLEREPGSSLVFG